MTEAETQAVTSLEQSGLPSCAWPPEIESRRVRLLTLAFDVLENALTDKSNQRWAVDKLIDIFKPSVPSSAGGPNFNMINLGPGGLDTALHAISKIASGRVVDASEIRASRGGDSHE